MRIKRVVKESFAVIGKEGSTAEGDGFIQKLWNEANLQFEQVKHLAKKDDAGNLVGIWGAMSDFTRSFLPWEDFNKGLYLAGIECVDGAIAPEGWTKWTIPGYVYLCSECDSDHAFSDTLNDMKEQGLCLVGAVHDFTCPQTGKQYLFFPIRKL